MASFEEPRKITSTDLGSPYSHYRRRRKDGWLSSRATVAATTSTNRDRPTLATDVQRAIKAAELAHGHGDDAVYMPYFIDNTFKNRDEFYKQIFYL